MFSSMANEDMSGCSHIVDASDERPLKKAKYVWQVKGKYHLKSNSQNKTDTETNNKACNCYKLKKNKDLFKERCIDQILAKSESILDSDELGEEDDGTAQNIDNSISNEIPITLVSPNPKNLDYYLRKWQARQIARGYIDNTINNVLETWAPARFDAEDFVEKCDEDGHVEDEGILMAIQAHGLQSHKSLRKESSLAFVRPDELVENALGKIENVEHEITKKLPASRQEQLIDPVDIWNAAILVAIEKKGLSS